MLESGAFSKHSHGRQLVIVFTSCRPAPAGPPAPRPAPWFPGGSSTVWGTHSAVLAPEMSRRAGGWHPPHKPGHSGPSLREEPPSRVDQIGSWASPLRARPDGVGGPDSRVPRPLAGPAILGQLLRARQVSPWSDPRLCVFMKPAWPHGPTS